MLYRHHEESIERLKEYFWDRPEVIALIFGAARGRIRIWTLWW